MRAMSSLIVSEDLHLMMLEISVTNLFVPWTSDFDKVILKKTIVMFRMLDEEWTSLSPNRRDHRPYRGSCHENEEFYGGRSVVFGVPASFLKEKASGVDVQLRVRKEACKYFEMDLCQSVGFVAVPVDDLLNGIARQNHERNELAEHLSDFYKRQIISRSTMGTYTLLDENFRDTAATISLYIRISYLGKCVMTEITRVESARGLFRARGELDEEEPYYLQQLTPADLQSGRWDDSLPRAPRGRLICHCEKLIREKIIDATNAARGVTAIAGVPTVAEVAQGAIAAIVPAVADAAQIAGRDVAAIDAMGKAVADYGAFGDRKDAEAYMFVDGLKRTTIPMAIGDEVIDGDRGITGEKLDSKAIKDVKASAAAAARAKAKGRAVMDNAGMAFGKAFLGVPTSTKSKNGSNATTIGEGERRTSAPSPPLSCLQTYPLCCRLQPTCFDPCLDALLCCYCHWTAHPLQFCHYA